MQRYYALFGLWEPQITAFVRGFLRPGDGFCDVGAHIGYYSLLAAQITDPSNIVAVEPLQANYDHLKFNLALNDASAVQCFRVAAYDRACELGLHVPTTGNLGQVSVHRQNTAPAEQVPAAPMADLLSDEQKSRTRLMKIDTEGCEGEVLNGLGPLDRYHPEMTIICEVSTDHLRKPHGEFARVQKELATSGFNFFAIDNNYKFRYYMTPKPRPVRPWRLTDGSKHKTVDLLITRMTELQVFSVLSSGAQVAPGSGSSSGRSSRLN